MAKMTHSARERTGKGEQMEKGRYFKKVYFDRQILLIAAVVSLMVLYYINPLENTVLETWDRTFCDAMVGGGVSIAKRIRNFYICYVFLPPLFMAFFSVLAGGILQGRAEYKKAFVMMDTVLVPALAAAYVSRHSLGSQAVADNPVLITAMIYQMLMLCAGLFDREGILTAGRLVFLYISYMVSAVAAVLLVPGMGINKSAIIAGSLFLVLLIFLVNRSGIGSRVYGTVENVLSLWMWLPAVACIVLEGLYILNERGAEPVRYNTVIHGFCMAYASVSLAVILLLRRVKMSLCPAGYMGALAGLGCIVYIPYSYYQSALVFLDNDHIYELGNLAFASDTLRSGKLPIIDYFSAHALSDTLPSILYGFLNADPDGGLAVPYSGLWDFLGLVVVYLILKKLFRKEYAILFVCIFPLSLGLTKTTSACMMVVLAMICVLEQKGKKAHVIFWLAAMAGVLIRYDEGVNLGVGCIAAIICILVLRKDKKCVKQFLLLGVFIAAGALLAYFGYCKITGIHAMRRILEWMSLTADSDSTWALNTLGDTGSPAFFVSYMAVPVCTVSALAAVVAGFVTDRRKPVAAAMAAAFCISGILFIPRTIVFHNLAVGSGRSGVLFNFVHWMAASFAFYVFAVKEKKEGVCFAAWVAAFCIFVAGYLCLRYLIKERWYVLAISLFMLGTFYGVFEISLPGAVSPAYYLLFFFVGYSFEKVREKLMGHMVLSAAAALTGVVIAYHFTSAGVTTGLFWEDWLKTLGICACAVLVFVLSHLLAKINMTGLGLYKLLEKHSFYIYLLHDPLNYVMLAAAAAATGKIGEKYSINWSAVGFLLPSLRIFGNIALCIIVSAVLRKIKFARTGWFLLAAGVISMTVILYDKL